MTVGGEGGGGGGGDGGGDGGGGVGGGGGAMLVIYLLLLLRLSNFRPECDVFAAVWRGHHAYRPPGALPTALAATVM